MEEYINLKNVPLTELREKGRLKLSQLLNPPKILPSENGYPRDWRGIAYLAGLENTNSIAIHQNAMANVLQMWIKENKETATFGNLCEFLGLIDRWDVADDIQEFLREDARFFLQVKQQQIQISHQIEITVENSDENIITLDDMNRAQQGLPPQFYDAFVLFADEDIDFATELIEKMEIYGFRLCVRDNLIGGISFEHEAILRLISERCNRLIVIVSPAFLKSRANTFFVNYAQALGIEQGRRKILPCLYERCNIPPSLHFYFILDYQRSNKLWNFWDKLRLSILSTPIENNGNSILNTGAQLPMLSNAHITDITKSSKEDSFTEAQNSLQKVDLNHIKTLPCSGLSSTSLCEAINNHNMMLRPLEVNLRAQSLINLHNQQQQQQQRQEISPFGSNYNSNCDTTKLCVMEDDGNILKISQVKNSKNGKWYKKFLSVSSIFDNNDSSTSSPVKNTKKSIKKGLFKKKPLPVNA